MKTNITKSVKKSIAQLETELTAAESELRNLPNFGPWAVCTGTLRVLALESEAWACSARVGSELPVNTNTRGLIFDGQGYPRVGNVQILSDHSMTLPFVYANAYAQSDEFRQTDALARPIVEKMQSLRADLDAANAELKRLHREARAAEEELEKEAAAAAAAVRQSKASALDPIRRALAALRGT